MGLRYLCILFAAFVFIIFSGFFNNIEAQKRINALQTKIEKLSTRSGLVVVGKVTGIKSEWNKEKNRIYTKVSVNVEDYVKGSEPVKNIVVTHLGGEVGSVGELYSGEPRFKSDEEVMLFLHKNKNGNLNVTSGAGGKFIVKRDKVTKMKMLEGGVHIESIKTMIKNNQRMK